MNSIINNITKTALPAFVAKAFKVPRNLSATVNDTNWKFYDSFVFIYPIVFSN